MSTEKAQKVIVVGCGRVGAQLASRLFQKGMQVTVIDESKAAFDNLDPSFRGRTLEGDVLAQDMLKRAGIERADSLASVTSSDTVNVAVAHIGMTIYHVPYVVARNYEPRYQSLYESFGVNAVSMSNWGAQRIEELLAGVTLKTVFSAGNGEVEVYELTIPESWDGRQLGDLGAGCGCVPVAVTRGGKAMLPDRDIVLQAGDVVHISATFEGIEGIRQQLSEAKGG
jgi:trk system potassium uptake protein TrkA